MDSESSDGSPRYGLRTAFGITVMHFDDAICRFAVERAKDVIAAVENYNRLVTLMPDITYSPYGPLPTVEFAMRELRFTIKDRSFDLSRGRPDGGIAVQVENGWWGFPEAFRMAATMVSDEFFRDENTKTGGYRYPDVGALINCEPLRAVVAMAPLCPDGNLDMNKTTPRNVNVTRQEKQPEEPRNEGDATKDKELPRVIIDALQKQQFKVVEYLWQQPQSVKIDSLMKACWRENVELESVRMTVRRAVKTLVDRGVNNVNIEFSETKDAVRLWIG